MVTLALAILLAAQLSDPGKSLPKGQARDNARKSAWQRPEKANQPDDAKIKALRDERIADARGQDAERKAKGQKQQKIGHLSLLAPPYHLTQTHKFTVIVFPSKSVADAIMLEIAATPDIDGGSGPVWLWYDPDGPVNEVGMSCEDGAGRCAIAHWWALDSPDVEWIKAYVNKQWPGITIHDSALPADWKFPVKIASASARGLWMTSLVALLGANLADGWTSWNKPEANRVLSGSSGTFGPRGAAIKTGITAGFVVAQWTILRKFPRHHRLMAAVNFCVATILTIATVWNVTASGNSKEWAK